MIENETKVKVIDSLMGQGKSSWARQEMKSHPNRHYIYVTPFLSEVERAIEMCPETHLIQPDNKHGKRKITDFNDLLFQGQSIATTHVTFSNATEKTIEFIKNGHYILMLDEVLDVLIDFNSACGDRITRDDIRALTEKGFIQTNKYNQVEWIAESYIGSAYSNVERCAKNGNLYLINGTMLIWAFPHQVFEAFDEVYVMTYMFSGSYLKPYMENYNIPYELVGVEKDSTGKYQLCEYKNDIAIRARFKQLIEVYNNQKANHFESFSLSSTDYKSRLNKDRKSQRAKELKNGLKNYIRNVCKVSGDDVMWTCPKSARSWLKGKGYTGRELTAEEQLLPFEQRADLIGRKTCFVPCNARASNEYRNKHVLAYLINFYPNPVIKDFFTAKNRIDGTNIGIDDDMFALSAMLQWIWRSAIREGEVIKIWIPSTRMRSLLIWWLDGECGTETQLRSVA